jgi:hypothetical protein
MAVNLSATLIKVTAETAATAVTAAQAETVEKAVTAEKVARAVKPAAELYTSARIAARRYDPARFSVAARARVLALPVEAVATAVLAEAAQSPAKVPMAVVVKRTARKATTAGPVPVATAATAV